MRTFRKSGVRGGVHLAKISSSCFVVLFALHTQAACDYQITNQWNNGFTAAIKITNSTSAAINGWSVSWQYVGDNRISNSWNASVSGSNPYAATNLNWNGSIQPNQTVEFGFQGTKGSIAEIPVITGAPCRQHLLHEQHHHAHEPRCAHYEINRFGQLVAH